MAACETCGQPAEAGAAFCGACGWLLNGVPQPGTQISCPVCWAPNTPRNLHCEQCGGRLGLTAPDRPRRRRGGVPPTGAGVITAGFVAVLVLMAALVVLSVGRTDEAVSTTLVSPTTIAFVSSASPFVGDPVGPRPVEGAHVSASSELSPEFGAGNLIDGDTATVWRDASRRGEGATVTFSFAEPVTVDAVVVAGNPDDDEFHTGYRVHGVRVVLGDGEVVEGEIPDSPEPFRIQIGGRETDEVTVEVTSTYPSEPHGGEPGSEELAIGEIEILGSPAG